MMVVESGCENFNVYYLTFSMGLFLIIFWLFNYDGHLKKMSSKIKIISKIDDAFV